MKRELKHEIVVNERKTIVWVNNATDGSCIGRFSKTAGMDIHRTGTEQMEGKGECLYCTHGKPTYEDWRLFVQKMYAHYKIEIPLDLIKFKEHAG